ncbi:Glycosyltransferase family 64 protein C4 [Zea mays]|uniref:Glycosyltransferase family 64 protein C4 n=2 Tax=Zea mays TaxID=4577 RepID=A0A3L6EX13_MAIZE|nr:Glycosyltransferase family 64 protein C4 [Zea mays]
MPRMAKLLLQLKAAADRRHGPGPGRRHPLAPRHAAASATRFVPACLALAAAAATTLVALALTLQNRGLGPADPSPSSVSPRGGGFAVVVNTWRRPALLRRSVAHYAACGGVDAVHVVWSEPRPPPEPLRRGVLGLGGARRRVRFEINAGDSLNNRFRPIRALESDAVFSVDDDLIVPCSALRFAFSVWRTAPSAMVGFVPRMHWPTDPRSTEDAYRYGSWWSVWWTGTYSMVLSKAGFFHKKYLEMYTNQMPPSIRRYVDENRNCEDIAMAFLVANATGAPPIWVQGRIFEIGSSGISSLKGHGLQRSRCLNAFAAMYGHMPLVATTVKAVDSRGSWFW